MFYYLFYTAWDLWTSDKGLCPFTVYFQCFLIIKAAALWYMQFVRMGHWSSATVYSATRAGPRKIWTNCGECGELMMGKVYQGSLNYCTSPIVILIYQ
ncbi:hypothetical protein HOLleu_36658 [Holothuria leucospilota]|uniref:Uncharacterized protein n=1 Tax=Holothuria leucospilota TaxID=206669 RepID=A0A9Q0YMH0_HOLLE|nr:hypothetical protein HOLleu_36658 [Holothuria leucospilota]